MATKWYVQTDAFTNEVLARELARSGIIEQEAATEVLYRGKKVSVWRVPYQFVTQLQKSKSAFPISFTVLVQENGGTVRKWNLQGRGKLSRQKSVRAIKRTLAHRKK